MQQLCTYLCSSSSRTHEKMSGKGKQSESKKKEEQHDLEQQFIMRLVTLSTTTKGISNQPYQPSKFSAPRRRKLFGYEVRDSNLWLQTLNHVKKMLKLKKILHKLTKLPKRDHNAFAMKTWF